MNKRFIIISALLFFILKIEAQITLPSIFSNGMVLQQRSDVAIWGDSRSGKSIQIKTSWNNQVYSVTTKGNGIWETRINTPAAGGPYNIEINNKAGDTIIIKEVWVGEVWICSGQSNMVVPVKNVINANAETEDANFPQIHFFKVPQKSSVTPIKDIDAKWDSPTNETVLEYGAVAFFFSRNMYKHLNVPIGIIHTSYGASNNEAWLSEEYLTDTESAISLLNNARNGKLVPEMQEQKIPTGLYNAMFKPIVPYTVKGVCWYQGEANSKTPNDYELLLTNLIKSWRIDLQNADLPFILIQLSGYKTPYKNGWLKVQEIQYKVSQDISKVATVMTYDIGDSTTIHPKNKQDVASRAGLAARRLAYLEDIVAQGPVMESYKIEGNKAQLLFKNTSAGLVIKGESDRINNFMIAGDDKVYYPAIAILKDRSCVEVGSIKVVNPKYIRYAFACFNPDVNLYNSIGIPAIPFRTDNFILEGK